MKRIFVKPMKLFSLIIAAAVLICCLPFSGMSAAVNAYYNSNNPSFTAPDQEQEIFTSADIALTNGSFSSSTSDFNQTVSGWTAALTSSNAVYGTLNTLRFNSFLRDDKNNISSTDFMINPNVKSSSGDTNVIVMANKQQNTKAGTGYESQSVTLEPNAYYIITADFYAVKSTGTFYLVLGDDAKTDSGIDPYIDIHSTSHQWKTATFFVKTDMLQSVSCKLGLYLGSKNQTSGGVVYFDSVKVTQCSNRIFEQQWEKVAQPDANGDTAPFVKFVDFEAEYGINRKIGEDEFPEFVNGTEGNGTNVKTSISLSEIPTLLNFEETDKKQPVVVFPYEQVKNNDNEYINPSVMLLSARESHASFITDTPFLVKRHKIYMLSFYVLSGSGSTCYIRIRDERLVRAENDENYTIPSYITPYNSDFTALKFSTSSELDQHNGWVLNTVFITGESYYDVSADIELWVGKPDTDATDWMALTDFSIQSVSAEYYEKYKASSSASDLVLDKNEATPTITNSFFNLGTPRNVENTYPLTAKDWTWEGDESQTISGIVNTQNEHWTEYNSSYGIAFNPLSNNSAVNNNVYMMQNRKDTVQSLKSNLFPLSVNTYNVISFQTYAIYNKAFGINAKAIVLTEDDLELAVIDLGFKAANGTGLTNTGWKTHTVAIKDSAVTYHQVKISFVLGDTNSNTNATVLFIDNVTVSQSTESKQDWNATANLSDPSKSASPDGTSIAFKSDDGISTAYSKTNDLLTIKKAGHSSETASVANQLTETVESGKFYRYTINASISELESMRIRKFDSEMVEITDYDANYEYGINFRLDGFDGGFYNLDESDIRAMKLPENTEYRDGFTDLVFYIMPESTTDLSLIIQFGNENMSVTGDVYIKSITLEEITEDIFKNRKADYDDAVANDKKIGYTNTAFATVSPYLPDEPDTSEPETKGELNFLVIPSIITAIAIIVAIVGFMIRKLRFGSHIRKQHTSYANDSRSVHTAHSVKQLRAKKASEPKNEKAPE